MKNNIQMQALNGGGPKGGNGMEMMGGFMEIDADLKLVKDQLMDERHKRE
jgi:hypothetical protein